MKENIERIFKEQLEHYELPFEAGAWDALSRRLDGAPSTPFYRKWWFAASVGTVLVGSATYFALHATDSPATIVETRPVAKLEHVSTASDPAPENLPGQAEAANQSQTAVTAEEQPTMNGEERPVQQELPAALNNITTPLAFPFIADAVNPATNNHTPQDAAMLPLRVPAAVCQNESIVIENPNAAELLITMPNGKQQTVQGKKAVTITTSEPGTIYLSSGKLRETIRVNETSSELYISMDASTLYENGIPTVKFDVSGAENAVKWESNVDYKIENGNHLVVHPFTERRVTVTATSTDQNGCKVTQTESINVQEYNLIAMEAFTPLGDIQANKIFMPFALTQRDAAFELTIYDARNGGQVFRTSDATRGWDGIDSRSGELVPANSTWMWKVIIKNPLPGEPKAYNGTITRL